MPVSSRKQLFDLSDDMATRVDVQFYADAREALSTTRAKSWQVIAMLRDTTAFWPLPCPNRSMSVGHHAVGPGG
jgi:hypothetical protein